MPCVDTIDFRYCVGVKPKPALEKSSAAVINSFDSSSPSAARTLRAVYAPAEVISWRTCWLFNGFARIIGRAASTAGTAVSSCAVASGVDVSGAVVTAASLSVSVSVVVVFIVVLLTVVLTLIELAASIAAASAALIFCTAAEVKAADSTRLTSRSTAAVTRR